MCLSDVAAEFGVVHRSLFDKRFGALVDLAGEVVHRQPVAGVAYRLLPGHIPPVVELLLRVAHAFGQLVDQLGAHRIDGVVEFGSRDNLIDQPPLMGLGDRNVFAEHENLAGSPIANE